jgi:hypothetical protein
MSISIPMNSMLKISAIVEERDIESGFFLHQLIKKRKRKDFV